MKKRFYVVIFLLVAVITLGVENRVEAQLDVNSYFKGFWDNREYAGSNIGRSTTIGGVNLGVNLTYTLDSVHTFRAGAIYMTQFGKGSPHYVLPEISYEYRDKLFDFKFGFVNNRDIEQHLPKYMLEDSVRYFKPTITGGVLKVGNDRFWQQVWLDWHGFQSESTKEMFTVGTQGKFFVTKWFNFYDAFMLNHIAVNSLGEDHIRDNWMATVGAKFTFDKLWENHPNKWVGRILFRAGVNYIISSDIKRNVYNYGINHAVESTVEFGFWRGLLSFNWYHGNGSDNYWGDPLYHRLLNEEGVETLRDYFRADLTLNFIKRDFVDVNVILTLHYTNKLMTQQRISVSLYMDEMYNTIKNKIALKKERDLSKRNLM